MCNYALVFFSFFIKATVSVPCEPCMSCRLVYHIASVMFICIFTRQVNGWMGLFSISLNVVHLFSSVDINLAYFMIW